jgi:hypothetical protein
MILEVYTGYHQVYRRNDRNMWKKLEIRFIENTELENWKNSCEDIVGNYKTAAKDEINCINGIGCVDQYGETKCFCRPNYSGAHCGKLEK